MADGISLREFGRQVGVSGEYVRRAIAEGKIPKDCIGERQVGKRTWPVITDPARAAEHWGKSRDPNQVRDKAAMSAGAKRGWAQRRGEAPPPDDDDHDDPPPASGVAAAGGRVGGVPSITDSKAITEAYKARTAKLDYEERAGKLVNADQVKVGFINQVTAARNKLLGVPTSAKSRIPTLTVRDIEILEEMIAEALEEVAVGG